MLARMDHDGLAIAVLRAPGPFVPGWFPLVVERAHRAMPRVRADTPVSIRGFRMELDLNEYMQRRLFYHCYEAAEARFCESWLRPGDVVVDVGAHVGFFTLLAARRVGPGGSVHAFEPIPENFERLGRNIELNGFENVQLNQVAVTDYCGEVHLGVDEERMLGTSSGNYAIGGALGTVAAPATTLDTYLDEHVGGARVRLLKVDAEGAEPKIFAGLQETLERNAPDAVLFEVNAKALAAHGGAQGVTDVLTAHDYSIRELTPRGHLKPEQPIEQLAALGSEYDAAVERYGTLRFGLATRRYLFNVVALRRDCAT